MDSSPLKCLVLVFICVASVVQGTPAAPRLEISQLKNRILGGQNAVITNYPYQVSIERWGYYNCSGAIISSTYVLTLASCAQYPKEELSVRAGSSLRQQGGKVYNVDKVVLHEKFSPATESSASLYDVAVMRVTEPFVFDDSCQQASLFTVNEALAVGAEVELTGWGETKSGGGDDPPVQMQLASLTVLEPEHCRQIYAQSLCAAAPGKDVCRGDAGSLLSFQGRLAALASWKFLCSQDNPQPILFTEVACFRDWIDEHAIH